MVEMRICSINQILRDAVVYFRTKEYIIMPDQGKSISYGEFVTLTQKLMRCLRSYYGIRKGDVVTLISSNSIETLAVYFAVMAVGAIVNPIYREETEQSMKHVLTLVSPKLVVVEAEMMARMQKIVAEVPLSCQVEDLSDLIQRSKGEGPYDLMPEEADPNGICEFACTSGTTSAFPKVVAHSQGGLYLMVDEVADRLDISVRDRILDYRAYNWMSVQLLSILCALKTGATLVFAKRFSRTNFSNLLKEYRVTVAAGVPAVINMLLKEPISLRKEEVPYLRFMTSSAAPLSVDSHLQFEERYGITVNQMMGMTEAGWIAGNIPSQRRVGTVGIPFKYKKVFFLNKRDEMCKVGEEGEMVVTGDSIGIGYVRDRREIEPFPRKEIRSGDLGYYDRDGYIFLTGRKKEIIIKGGINISPWEIVDFLSKYDKVKEVAVIGVPDPIYGEEIACFVVPTVSYHGLVDDLKAYCEAGLPRFKQPKYFIILDELPRTAVGKIAKHLLLDIFEQVAKKSVS